MITAIIFLAACSVMIIGGVRALLEGFTTYERRVIYRWMAGFAVAGILVIVIFNGRNTWNLS